jgi:hypothetical protein
MDFTACILQKSDDKELIPFLNRLGEKYEQVLGYHYPFYRDMLEHIDVGTALYVGIKNNAGTIQAVLPGFIKTQKEGSVYSSLPFFGPNGGPLYDFNSENKDLVYKLVFDFLFKKLEEYEMVSASFYTPFNTSTETTFFKNAIPGGIEIEKFTSYIPLTNFQLANEFVDSSALRNVRKAEKSGVTLRTTLNEGDIDIIYSIYAQNCADYGIPLKPKETLIFLLNNSAAKENVKTFIAEFEGKIIGALIMIYSPGTASYYIPCNVHEYRNFQPNAFLIASAIEDAKKTERKFWNWESSPSKESGVYQFKKKWGSVDSDYSIFVKPFKETSFFSSMGKPAINKLYPYFFVYPFNLIEA